MKRLFFTVLTITLLVGSVSSKEKKLTKSEARIAEFKKERGDLVNKIKQYENAIQNCKYRIAQLNFGVELLEEMGAKKK